MVIAYLQHIGVIGNLQAHVTHSKTAIVREATPAHKPSSSANRTVDVSFSDLNSEYVKEQIENSKEYLKPASQWGGSSGVPALFYGFMAFYSSLDFEPSTFISVKHGGIVKLPPIDARAHLVVLDPFEKDRICTRMVDNHSPVIKNEFKRGHELIASGDLLTLFEPRQSKK